MATPTTDTHERTYCATAALVVTPNDSADLSIGFTRRIICGVSGDLKVTTIDTTLASGVVVIPAACIIAGVPLDIAVTRIWASGTTATSIVAFK